MVIHLEITGKCNLYCKHCYNSKYNNPLSINHELTHGEWLSVITEANALDCERFNFSGGEPLLYQDGNFNRFMELVNLCSVPVVLLTNGHFLTSTKFKKLVETDKLCAIRFSLDGLESHKLFRTGSDYKTVLERVSMVRRQFSLPIAIVTMLNHRNLTEIFQIYELLKNLKVNRWNIDIPFYCDAYKDHFRDFRQASFQEIIATIKNLIKIYLGDNKPFQLGIANIYKSEIVCSSYYEFTTDIHPCCYHDSVCIKPNGDINACAAYDLWLANIRESGSLALAIRNAKLNQFFSMRISDIDKCCKCRYIRICGGGCRADAKYLTGSDSQPDPLCCSLLPLVEKEIFPILPAEEKDVMISLCNLKGDLPNQCGNIAEIIRR